MSAVAINGLAIKVGKNAGLVFNQRFLESVRRSVLETWLARHLVGRATLGFC